MIPRNPRTSLICPAIFLVLPHLHRKLKAFHELPAEDGNPGDACRVHWQCLGMAGSLEATFPVGRVL